MNLMKLQASIIVLFATFTLAWSHANGQTVQKSDSEQTYTFGQCKINVNLVQESSFTISATYGYFKRAMYSYPLQITHKRENGFEVFKDGRFSFSCKTGSSQKDIDISSRGRLLNGTWYYGSTYMTFSQATDFEPEGFELTGDNWKGVLTVTKIPPPDENEMRGPDYPYRDFSFCLQENNGPQVICGGGLIYLDGDVEINKAIEALKTIRFDPTFVSASPSFDCTKLKTVMYVERAICAEAELSRLDAVLDLDYGQLEVARLNTKKRADEQRAWIKVRNACGTPQCIRNAYVMRIDHICAEYHDSSHELPLCINSSSALSSDPEWQDRIKRAIEALKAKRLRKR